MGENVQEIFTFILLAFFFVMTLYHIAEAIKAHKKDQWCNVVDSIYSVLLYGSATLSTYFERMSIMIITMAVSLVIGLIALLIFKVRDNKRKV